ncbi:hypothetical protein H6G52_08165 [Limnothrix sp. FACHB-881]|uniref:hypothetical protein n=1 Tax=Limnothrix sp. FACHB-881 TaxID=2692819 RepID=UPI001683F1B8|nr:hypothetical protein [Limnothrix sp. FACHB-881]MBD2635328.1 hypothetical protein [Limnothrix sp. FACHB-881]
MDTPVADAWQLLNWHVIDPKNIGDLLAAPSRYLTLAADQQAIDLRRLDPETRDQTQAELLFGDRPIVHVVGGGGLLFDRFQKAIQALVQQRQQSPDRTKLIAWGPGQQIYGKFTPQQIQNFDYRTYLDGFDLVGLRDAHVENLGLGYHWLPCASCLHPAFDQPRLIRHEFVVFSHKKFQIDFPDFPRMTNEETDFETVLNFLGSGETILTSSYHGAYWGTLLGRRVLAFPFTSKTHTLKHQPGIFPIERWRPAGWQLKLLGKTWIDRRRYDRFTCDVTGWQRFLKQCRTYPESLQETRDRNHWFYQRVLELTSAAPT